MQTAYESVTLTSGAVLKVGLDASLVRGFRNLEAANVSDKVRLGSDDGHLPSAVLLGV